MPGQRSRRAGRSGRRNAAGHRVRTGRWNRRGASGSSAGTELATVSAVPERAERSRIAAPGNGLIIAIDPDIPADRQRVPIRARGATAQLAFRMDGEALGAADSQLLWSPRTGAHRLALVDRVRRVVDQVLFTVR